MSIPSELIMPPPHLIDIIFHADQGIDPVVSAFGSEWAALEDGNMESVDFNNTFSYLWSLFKPFHERSLKLDFLYIGFKNGAMLGYGLSTSDLDVPGEAWWQPNRNSKYSCSRIMSNERRSTRRRLKTTRLSEQIYAS